MKNIYSTILFLSVLILGGCNERKNEFDILQLIPQENIRHYLDSVIENNQSEHYTVNEIFINRMMGNAEIIVHRGQTSKVGRHPVPALAYTTVQGVKFSIYSGLEFYFSSIDVKENKQTIINEQATNDNTAIWIINDSCGTMSMRYFAPQKTLKFVPSVMEEADQ